MSVQISIYSQTGCCFDDNLANFCRNGISILIDSLSGLSCSLREQVARFILYRVAKFSSQD